MLDVTHKKSVVVIGGGDTGSDCIGTSIRQGANSVTNFEIMPMATEARPENQPWPFWPMRLRTSTSHKEGAERVFSISTKEFLGDNKGNLKALKTIEVELNLLLRGCCFPQPIPVLQMSNCIKYNKLKEGNIYLYNQNKLT